MRSLLFAVVVAGSLSTAHAQVRLGVLANTGYDFGYAAPSLGVGGEVSWEPPASGVRLGVRVSGDYVFLEQAALPGPSIDGDVFGRRNSATRVGIDALAHWEAAPAPVVPYVRYGLAWEEWWERRPNVSSGASGLTASSGVGMTWNVLYVEAAYGVSVRSYARNNVGGGRIAVGVTF